jgi:PAS domain S-box-containing protein
MKATMSQNRSQKGAVQRPGLLFILTTAMILLVIILAFLALQQIRKQIQRDTGEALQTVVSTTEESVRLWAEYNRFNIDRIARDPSLVSLVENQIAVGREIEDLLDSYALHAMRIFFNDRKDRFGQAGFFIIAPDFTSIASMRDDNIGDWNLIAVQRRDLLMRAFNGETVLVPPINSDVTQPSQGGARGAIPTMFFATPVRNQQGDVIAVLTQRIDPGQDFTRLIKMGRIGQSGETYAFSKYGKMLSESRFDQQLRAVGLLGESQSSIMAVSIRDPGGDLTQGFSAPLPRYQQPLTLMAQAATDHKKPGLNTNGYRDYRGVRVYGAWMWSDTLGIGLTTEIDEAEALRPYYQTRKIIVFVLGVTVVLALVSMGIAVLVSEKANRLLKASHDELEDRVRERTSELKENQIRLEQAEERSRLLLESAEEGIFGVGPDGLVNFINPAGLGMLGFAADDLIGRKIHTLIHHTRPDGTPYPIDACPMHQSLIRGVSSSRNDEVLWRKDGTSFPVGYTSVPIRKAGKIAGTVVVFRDISERKEAEQALRNSRATARGLLDATQESLLLLDKTGIILAVNQTAAHRHRQTPETLSGSNLFTILPPDLQSSRRIHFNSVLQTGQPVDFEDFRDGMVFHNVYHPVKDKDGATIGVAVFAQDITERKQAEEALRESENNMRTIFENSPLGMIHFSKDGTILDCNDRFVALMGSTREKLIGFNTPQQTRDERLRAAVMKALAGATAEYEGDYTSVTGDKTVSLRIVFNPTEPGASPTEVIATLEDITERKRAEEAIRESREKLDTILKTTAQGFWLNDQDDFMLEVNDAMCEILGRPKEEIVGRNFFDFLNEESREIVREQNRIRKQGIHSLYEISLTQPNGQLVPCLMNASPLLDKNGNVVGSFGMTTNIAKRKQMEETLRQKVDELERFSKVAYGRERKMIQLKAEINELRIQVGQGKKYTIVR